MTTLQLPLTSVLTINLSLSGRVAFFLHNDLELFLSMGLRIRGYAAAAAFIKWCSQGASFNKARQDLFCLAKNCKLYIILANHHFILFSMGFCFFSLIFIFRDLLLLYPWKHVLLVLSAVKLITNDDDNIILQFVCSGRNLSRMQLGRAVGHHTLEISDGPFRDIQLTVVAKAVLTKHVTARL